VKELKPHRVTEILHDWRYWARSDQLPPEENDWRSWLILGGRGSGKTRSGAEWVRALALGQWGVRAHRIAIVAPTYSEARLVMIEGQSGLLSVHSDDERPLFEPSKRVLTWPNGCVAHIFSADQPDSLRGPQFDAAWCDELAKWKHADAAWNMLQFALRLGENPVAVITTTPRPIPILRRLLKDAGTVTTHSTTFDNRKNLAPPFLAEVLQRYGGTRLGRQELNGELIDDDPNALFKRELIESKRVANHPKLTRIVVAVDPPAGFGKNSNACGIVCVGIDANGHGYVLEDATVQGLRPAKWAAHVSALYEAKNADRVVAEINQGGAMVEQVLREVNENISFRAVHATRGKKARAEPVAALYEQGRISHVGSFPALEDEMCSVIGEGSGSPDRLDALVWAVSDLMLKRRVEPRVRVV
jgi:phage terminase large subunit-like protein